MMMVTPAPVFDNPLTSPCRRYRICAELHITCITISHRPALQQHHQLKLELDGTGGYTLLPISARSYASATASSSASDDKSLQLVHRESVPTQVTTN